MGMCEDEMWKRRRRKGDVGICFFFFLGFDV
jgi:hypothetical protein